VDQRTLKLVALRVGMPEAEVRSVLAGERRWIGEFRARENTASVERRDVAPDDMADSGELRLVGYSAVFDKPSEVLYGFMREYIKRGAFKRVLKDPALDVRLLENHEGRPYARTTNGTLKLVEKPEGLYRDALLDSERDDAQDLYRTVKRGDYSQSSFAFTVKRCEWRMCDHAEQDDYKGCACIWERDVLEVGSLLDDSVVTYPAYPDSSVMVARESERSGERDVLASDEEQRETASDSDTSLTHSGSDPTKRLIPPEADVRRMDSEVVLNVYCQVRAPKRAC